MRFKTLEGNKTLNRVFLRLHRKQKYTHGFKRCVENKEIKYSAPKWRGIHGFDTETNKNGDVYLVSYSGLKNQTEENETDSIFSTDPYVLFSFLLSKGYGYLNVFYNLNFDFEGMIKGILKTVSPEKGQEQSKKGEFTVLGRGRPLKIKYIQSKFFKISNGKRQAYFYDCANFYEGSLDSESKKYLGYGKEKFGVSDSQIDVSLGTEKYGYALIRNRCETDATLTRLLFERVYETVKKLGVSPRYWNGKASLSEAFLIQKVEEKFLKPFKDNPLHRKVLEYAMRSFKGGIFVNFQKGLCTNISEVDIVSAYPHKIANLPDLHFGYWAEVTKINPEASFGIYHIRKQYDGMSPFRSETLKQIIYPKTRDFVEDYATAPEIYFWIKQGYLVDIIDGVEFYHTSKPVYPFSEIINELFELKQTASKNKDESMKNLAKTIMNAMYGKFVQSKHGLGKLFNPVYGSYITALTRIQITEIAIKYFERIDEIATDAVIGKLRYDIKEDSSLGGLEAKDRLGSEVVILQTGLTANKDGTILRNRGIPIRNKENSSKNKGKIEFNERALKIRKTRPLHMKECMIQKDLGAEKINRFEEIEKVFAYDDRKRIWSIPKITKQELFSSTITSEPYDETFLESFEDLQTESLDIVFEKSLFVKQTLLSHAVFAFFSYCIILNKKGTNLKTEAMKKC
jgi:hypothetical protein